MARKPTSKRTGTRAGKRTGKRSAKRAERRPDHDAGAHRATDPADFEAEALPGLEPFVAAELRARGAEAVQTTAEGEVAFRHADPGALHELRRAVAVYRRLEFAVPRPKALLGDQHFRRLLEGIERVRAHAPEPFRGFRFSAAGAESPVFARLARALQEATELRYDPDEGELLLRVRPGAGGWQVLCRLTPRPLSARAWRACNLPGGLNATLAVVANDLLGAPRPGSRYLNAMCGSGTLLVERALEELEERDEPAAATSDPGALVGVDADPAALACAAENLEAAGVRRRATLVQGDVTRPETFADGVLRGPFHAIVADPPWGDAVGSHDANARLYPLFLGRMRALAAADARLLVITHELRLFQGALASPQAAGWTLERELQVFHGGHRPKLFLLRA